MLVLPLLLFVCYLGTWYSHSPIYGMMARDICTRNYNKPFLGAFVLVFLVSLEFPLRYGQLKEYASSISISAKAPVKKPEQRTSTRDSAASSQNGNKDNDLVKTSRQCSSVLNLIYSGANVSLERANAGGSNDTHDTHSLVDSWLPSIHDLWQNKIHPRLLSHILDWTFSPLGFGNVIEAINQTKMIHAFQKAHNEFIIPNLRKSVIHPMQTRKMHTLLRIIELRLADPENHPPLEIMVFGPSVVDGYGSSHTNWWKPDHNYNRPRVDRHFAWPARLEDVLNDVVFRGQKVVRVTNVAVSGTYSTSGALALEYRLVAGRNPVPDIVLHSYGNTDTAVIGGDAVAIRYMQEFVLAAKKLRCHEDDLPHVILFDDYLGFVEVDLHSTLKNIRTVSQVADWYDVMAVSYASAFRHTIMAGEGFAGPFTMDDKDIFSNPTWDLPMLGWILEVHPAMLYHSTTPWVLAFNLLDNMVNSCQDYSTMLQYQTSYQKLSVEHIPALAPDKFLKDLPTMWKASIEAHEELCKNAPPDGASPCSRNSWLVNGAGMTITPKDVEQRLSAMYMDAHQNWATEGNQRGLGKPHVGWVATAPNATFTVTIKDTDHEGIKSMSVVALKSYGAKWAGSRLRVRVWDEGKIGQGPQSQILDVEIEGVHDLKVSTYFDHRFPLGIAGIPKENWLKAQFDVIGGTTFKIQGILFCLW